MKCLLALLLVFSGLAYSETWDVEKFITVTPPSDVDASFQLIEDFDPKQRIVVGWQGDALKYYMMFDQQQGGNEASHYWEGLKNEIKKASDNNKVEVLHQGQYQTKNGLDASFKIMISMVDGEVQSTVWHLIKNESVAYYVAAYTTDLDSFEYVTYQTVALLKSAELKNTK